MMKKRKKNLILSLVSAIVIAICCVFPCFSSNLKTISTNADSFVIDDKYKALHGFNMLDPVIWNNETFNSLFEQDENSPVGCYFGKGVRVNVNTDYVLGVYELPSSFKTDSSVNDIRFNFKVIDYFQPLGYQIIIDCLMEDNSLLTSYNVTSIETSNLPPPSVVSKFRFKIRFSSTDIIGLRFAPCLNYFFQGLIWQPFVNVGGLSQEEIVDLTESAYNQGFDEGKQYAKSGYFNDILIMYEIVTNNGRLGGNSIKPEVLYDGISLAPLYTELYNYSQLPGAYEILSVDWSVHFTTPVSFNSLKFGLYSTIDYAQTTNEYGDIVYKRYTAEVLADSTYYTPVRFVKVENMPGFRLSIARTVNDDEFSDIPQDIFESYAFEVSAISGFTTHNINDFKNFQFIGLGNSNYQVGFDNGYNAGVEDSQEMREESFELGIYEGKLIGRQEGYAEGFAAATSDDPYSIKEFAFTLLDLPGRILYNWLNFDLFGFNMAGLLSLLISALIVAYVWKKVT